MLFSANPEVLIIDENLAEGDSLNLIGELKIKYPHAQVILLVEQEELMLLKGLCS